MTRCRNPPKQLHGFKVAYEKLPSKYGGMNCRAAKDLKIPYPYPCSTILIDPDQSCKVIRDTIKNEIIEESIMKDTKLRYKKAHALTEVIEKVTK
jgi:hypothetical protein